jgi:hypothetical protein
MDRKNLSDRGKAIETKIDGKAKKDILRQICDKLHLDSVDHLPPLPDGECPRALFSRNNEKTLFTNLQIVETTDKGKSIIADENIQKGDSIFSFIGVALPLNEASYKSWQITDDLCIESTEGFDNSLNHSCNPNCYINFEQNPNQPVLVALRDIKKGEELSFDYNTTDYNLKDLKVPESFHCQCKASNCLGEIKGYKYLTPEQKSKISPYLAPYLRKYEKEI